MVEKYVQNSFLIRSLKVINLRLLLLVKEFWTYPSLAQRNLTEPHQTQPNKNRPKSTFKVTFNIFFEKLVNLGYFKQGI